MTSKDKSDEFKRKMALRFFQECGWEIEQLPAQAWHCIKQIDVSIYTIPLLKRDFERGTSRGTLTKRYRLSFAQIRRRLDTNTWKGAAGGGQRQ